jgi:hypothetical protein
MTLSLRIFYRHHPMFVKHKLDGTRKTDVLSAQRDMHCTFDPIFVGSARAICNDVSSEEEPGCRSSLGCARG